MHHGKGPQAALRPARRKRGPLYGAQGPGVLPQEPAHRGQKGGYPPGHVRLRGHPVPLPRVRQAGHGARPVPARAGRGKARGRRGVFRRGAGRLPVAVRERRFT